MLEAAHISYRIRQKKLLDDVSVKFEAGKIHLILGPNGAGKSTFVKIISGAFRPSDGAVIYAGRNIKDINVKGLSHIRAVLSQSVELAFSLTVREVVMMGRYPYFTGTPGALDLDVCEEVIQFFDLDNLKDRDYMSLSGGEQQRVHFARVAAQLWDQKVEAQKYLILDEPLTFLDVYYQFDFMDKLVGLARERNWTVVGVVHDLNLAGKYADSILLLHKGKVVAQGSREAVLTVEHIRNTYNLAPHVALENGMVRVQF